MPTPEFNPDDFFALTAAERDARFPLRQVAIGRDTLWVRGTSNADDVILANQPEGDAFRLYDLVHLRGGGVVDLLHRTCPLRLVFEYDVDPNPTRDTQRQRDIIARVKTLGSIRAFTAFSPFVAGVGCVYARDPLTEGDVGIALGSSVMHIHPPSAHPAAFVPPPTGSTISFRVTR